MADVNTALIVAALDSLGISTDAATVASVFGRLANLGLTSDAASSNGSALARLASIINYLNGTTTISAIGADPGSGNGNLTNVLKGLRLLYDSELSLIGNKNDTADSSGLGSVHAKLAALLQRVGGGAVSVFAQPVSLGSSQTTVLSVTGPGTLYSVDYQTGYSNFSAVIIADGRTIYSGNPFATLPNNYNFTPLFKGVLHFNSLLTITAAEGTAGGAAAFAITYATGVA